jgi:hypothetical protein
MPAKMPEKRGALEARATPRHSGSATRKTTVPASRSRDAVFKERVLIGFASVEDVDDGGEFAMD